MAKKAKYNQVVEWVIDLIARKELLPGDKLESEMDISTRFGVSRQTVRHALGILSRQGLIESRQGSGSYVREAEDIPARNTHSRTIVIVSTYVNGYIFPSVIQGMERVLERDGWNIQIMFTYNSRETEKKILKKLLEETELAGLIIEPTMSGLPNPNKKYYERMLKMGIPVLFFHSFYPALKIPHVSLNDEAAGKLAVEYLLSRGHTRIGGIFKLDDGQGLLRYQGYVKGMSDAKIGQQEETVTWIDTEDQHHMDLCREKILCRLEGCTACVCYNDEVAHDLTEICLQAGRSIPEDLSIVSIDNSELARLNSIPLTSVRHPMEELGVKVAENMLQLIYNPNFQATYEFEPKLEIRDSVRTWEVEEK